MAEDFAVTVVTLDGSETLLGGLLPHSTVGDLLNKADVLFGTPGGSCLLHVDTVLQHSDAHLQLAKLGIAAGAVLTRLRQAAKGPWRRTIDKDTKIVVMHCSSSLILAGFAGEDEPVVQQPSVILNSHLRSHEKQSNQIVGDAVYKPEERENRYRVTLGCPLAGGFACRDMEAVWQHLYFRELRVEPALHPVVLTEPPLMPRAERESIVQLFFELYQVPSICILPRPVCVLFARGLSSGVVLHVGRSASAVCVYEGHVMLDAAAGTCVPGSASGPSLTEELVKALPLESATLILGGAIWGPRAAFDAAHRVSPLALLEGLGYCALDFEAERRNGSSVPGLTVFSSLVLECAMDDAQLALLPGGSGMEGSHGRKFAGTYRAAGRLDGKPRYLSSDKSAHVFFDGASWSLGPIDGPAMWRVDSAEETPPEVVWHAATAAPPGAGKGKTGKGPKPPPGPALVPFRLRASLGAGRVTVPLGDAAFAATEPLFHADGESAVAVQNLVALAVGRCDVELRRQMLGRVALCGSMTALPGFKARLQRELERLAAASGSAPAGQWRWPEPGAVRVWGECRELPAGAPSFDGLAVEGASPGLEEDPAVLAWRGAARFARGCEWLVKAEYDERGPDMAALKASSAFGP